MEFGLLEIVEELNIDLYSGLLRDFFILAGWADNGLFFSERHYPRMVYIEGKNDEVYSKLERDFIESVPNVYVSTDFSMSSKRGYITCRYFAIDLTSSMDALFEAILFMKITIKAFTCYPVFLFKMPDGIRLGMRTFEKDSWNNCLMCRDIKETIQEIGDDCYIDNFMTFYVILKNALEPAFYDVKDFDTEIILRRGIDYYYINYLLEFQKDTGFDMSYAIERYKDSFLELAEEEKEEGFYENFFEIERSLENVRSFQINTLELLFEADEVEKEAADMKFITADYTHYDRTSKHDTGLIAKYGDDLEGLIKRLKQKKGIG